MKQANIKFTYHDYLLLPDDKRYELVEGELLVVPAPNLFHQSITWFSPICFSFAKSGWAS